MERAHEIALVLYIVYRLHGRGARLRLSLVLQSFHECLVYVLRGGLVFQSGIIIQYAGGDVVDFDGDGGHDVASFQSGVDGMIFCFHISRKKEDIQIYLNDAEER